jgi:hypothetical protein
MQRTLIVLAGLSFGLILPSGSSTLAQQPPDQPPAKKVVLPPFESFSKNAAAILALDVELEMKSFGLPMKLSEAVVTIVEQLEKKNGFNLRIVFDSAAFKFEAAKNAKLNKDGKEDLPAPIEETTIRMPTHIRELPVALILRLALSQVPQQNATYLIQKGTVIITTKERATFQNLLREKVVANFNQKPLVEAIYALSDRTGISITLDPRAAEALLRPVSATFGNDVSLESALMVLTDTAGLKIAVVGDAVYVTTPANAEKLSKSPKQ